ncbi:MAG: hypothetical protein EBW83_08365, partial [Rhodobacterales bacterium]|nr:hypothetical protein [Rhodobacterales bacterium]
MQGLDLFEQIEKQKFHPIIAELTLQLIYSGPTLIKNFQHLQLKQYLFINQPYRLMKMPINQNQKIIFLI